MATLQMLPPPPWRACMLCTHGTGPQHQRCCTSPHCAPRNQPQPVDLMRLPHGPCGPEALHLDFPGLQG